MLILFNIIFICACILFLLGIWAAIKTGIRIMGTMGFIAVLTVIAGMIHFSGGI